MNWDKHLKRLYSEALREFRRIDNSITMNVLKDRVSYLYDDTLAISEDEFADLYLSMVIEYVKYKKCGLKFNDFANELKKKKRDIKELEKLCGIETELIENLPKQPAYILLVLEGYVGKDKAIEILKDITGSEIGKISKRAVTYKELEKQRKDIISAIPKIHKLINNMTKEELIEIYKKYKH